MSDLLPLHWDFCLECENSLTADQIADDDSFCYDCMEAMNV